MFVLNYHVDDYDVQEHLTVGVFNTRKGAEDKIDDLIAIYEASMRAHKAAVEHNQKEVARWLAEHGEDIIRTVDLDVGSLTPDNVQWTMRQYGVHAKVDLLPDHHYIQCSELEPDPEDECKAREVEEKNRKRIEDFVGRYREMICAQKVVNPDDLDAWYFSEDNLEEFFHCEHIKWIPTFVKLPKIRRYYDRDCFVITEMEAE